MEVKSAGCPLGAKCEEVKEDKDGNQILYRCDWYVKVKGKHPQSNEEIDKWGCAIAWMPMLTLEGAQQTRQAGAAIESLRNEMVKGQQTILQFAAAGEAKRKLIDVSDDYT